VIGAPETSFSKMSNQGSERLMRGARILVFALCGCGALMRVQAQPKYTVAYSGFAPLNADMFIADADGRNPKPFLAHSAQDFNASFSRDGKSVVFTSERAGSADIYRAHPDGTSLERLTDDPSFDDQAALSPDGRTAAFISSRSGHAELWTLDLATKKVRNIINHSGGHFRPAWSPDGLWIAISSDRDSPMPGRDAPTDSSRSSKPTSTCFIPSAPACGG
jgi:TolB protein